MRKHFVSVVEHFLSGWGFRPARAKKGQSRRELRVLLRLPDRQPILVGRLWVERSRFMFAYSDEFRESGLPPIPGFPDVQRERYESETLWPFFQLRLPPSKREDVARVIKRQQLEEQDVFEMLHALGERTATSPYELRIREVAASA